MRPYQNPSASQSALSKHSAVETAWSQRLPQENCAARIVVRNLQALQMRKPVCSAPTGASRPGGTDIVMNVPVQRSYRIPVQSAERCLLITAEPTENTALRSVIVKEVRMMDSKAFQALLGYKSAMAQARIMLSKGLITTEDIGIIETKMCEIFGINFDSLYRENDWIISGFRGNMSPVKEVV